jgi:ABC-type multidrug transport system ATPase subunit
MAKFEKKGMSADLLNAPPDTSSSLPGLAHWIFFGVQFFLYPVIAAGLERVIHGVAAESRKVYKGQDSGSAQPEDAVRISGLTKVYQPSLIRRIFSFVLKPRAPIVAVDSLNLSVKRGQILSLLGANGSGKSTTLDAIAGMHRFNQGNVSIDASGGIGIAPQKNVLWDDLTVYEHLSIFNQLKCPEAKASTEELRELITAIGLSQKIKARSNTLSGGQKRKLQLGMMLTGGSAVCCVDEVSSGIDPLSRRKIWDILLSERGRRTIIMTTHFLDEADLLSDDIAILSKGTLRAQGSPVALKHRLGAGYRVHVLNAKQVRHPPSVEGVACKITSTNIEYTAPSSQLAADVIRALEAARIEYRLSSPTIDDVFLHVAEEAHGQDTLMSSPSGASSSIGQVISEKTGPKDLELLSGRQTGVFTQTAVLLRKRLTILKTNWIPYTVAFLIPVITAAATHVLIKNMEPTGCLPMDQGQTADPSRYSDIFDQAKIAVGPKSSVQSFLGDNLSGIDVEYSNSLSDLRNYIEDHRSEVTPGGWWAGNQQDSTPTIMYAVDHESSYIMTGFIAQNLLNRMRTNTTIQAMYLPFDSNVPKGVTKSIMLMAFFCIAVSIAPAFFGFYPNVERRSSVRGLQYSSGVRSFPLWFSHLSLDYTIFAVAFIAAAVAYIAGSDVWYNGGYLFPTFLLYGLCSILLAYGWSLFMGSQLATFAAIFVYNLVGFGIYLISFLFITSFSPAPDVDRNVLIGHYTISVFFPVGSLFRAMMVGLNVFGAACNGYSVYDYPGDINAYGAPILYLSVQSILLFLFLLYQDSGNKLPSFMTRKKSSKSEGPWNPGEDQEAATEEAHLQTNSGQGGLQVRNLVKSFGEYTAVDNVTFGVQHSEVFALLGPNGAGKSTTISLIRGDIPPSKNGGDVFIENISVTDHRALARSNLGVCPQFDAIDNMTVLDHLRHYARLRGIADVERQVQAVVRAVGLEAYIHTMAPHLSGGNKRKLSLGIALTGNPSVILLDEPSSGLDAAAKRIMWRTLEGIVPGRSILLTTHSMEEADALASRAGIMARRMLAVGEVNSLRSRFGDSLYVHLISKTAPYSTPTEMERMRAWIQHLLPDARIEPETYHGQMRFSVPASVVLERAAAQARQRGGSAGDGSAIGQLILMLEENKGVLGIEHHSVSPTTLNDVFLSIVGQHNVQEEGYTSDAVPERSTWLKVRKFLFMF